MKFALLQLASNYPGSGFSLRGCLNDLLRVGYDLQQRRHLERVWYRAAHDTAMELAAMRGHIQDWCQLPPEKAPLRILQFSGHGTLVPDVSGDESSGFDSALVPNDFARAGLLLDDEIAAYLQLLPEGVIAWLVVDACHSGTIQRGFLPHLQARFLGRVTPRCIPTERLPQRVILRTQEDALNSAMLGRSLWWPTKRSRPKPGIVANNERVVVIAGASASQTAADVFFEGQYGGIATIALSQAWQRARDSRAINVVSAANRFLESRNYSQVIQLEGTAENHRRRLFE